MSGHSKWASIKHKKGAADAKRGKVFTKVGKEITIAARMGGGDPASNPRLRTAVQKAKEANMPADNIKRAIQKGTGELPGVSYEEVTYEGYGPGGVAIFMEATTDNKNRTVSEIRNIFTKRECSLASSGAVGYLFVTKGRFVFEKSKTDENALFEAATEAGAEDLKDEGETIEVLTDTRDFETIKAEFEKRALVASEAEITKIPSTYVKIEDESMARRILALIESLQDHDDIQNVYANFDMDDSLMQKISEA